MSGLDSAMRSAVNGLARDLADELRGVDGAVEKFLDCYVNSGDLEAGASAALHVLDDIFGDGGQYRCEWIVDPIVEELVGSGMSFAEASECAYWEPVVEVIKHTASLLR